MDNRTIQRALKAKGYYSGEIDGILGPKSLAGIAAAIAAAPTAAQPDKKADSNRAQVVAAELKKPDKKPDKKADNPAGGMLIFGGRLEIVDRPTPFIRSPNHGGLFAPSLIIVHDTAGPSAQSAINWFKNPKAKVSAHFVVDLDGSITQMVETDRIAWHAGRSSYNGRGACNAFAVGIEIVNPGRLGEDGRGWWQKPHEAGYAGCEACTTREHGPGWWVRYPPEQVSAVTALCRALCVAYPAIRDIRPHWYVSPGRKVDTNPLFPLEELRAAVLGSEAAVA